MKWKCLLLVLSDQHQHQYCFNLKFFWVHFLFNIYNYHMWLQVRRWRTLCKLHIYLFYMYGCCACVPNISLVPTDMGERVGVPGSRFTDGCELLYGSWESKSLLEASPVILTAESSSPVLLFVSLFCFVLLWEKVSLCSSNWPGSYYVDKSGFKLEVSL